MLVCAEEGAEAARGEVRGDQEKELIGEVEEVGHCGMSDS